MDSKGRILIKRGAGVATIPASADHRNGDWIATDIYEGELYLDTTAGVLYTRNSVGIIKSDGQSKAHVCKLLQAGVAAPTQTVGTSNLTGTISYTYIGVGVYNLVSTDSEFLVNKTFIFQGNHTYGFAQFIRISDTTIQISTYDLTGTPANGWLDHDLKIEIYL